MQRFIYLFFKCFDFVLIRFEAEEEEPSQPFTQLQLQEAKQLVLSLMRESKLGLVAVTKALLKNSGDVSAALRDPLMMPIVGR